MKDEHEPMTKEQVRFYVDRWETVRALERRELRRMSLETRFQQTAALFAAGITFPKDDVFARQRAEEAEGVRRTWARIKGGKV